MRHLAITTAAILAAIDVAVLGAVIGAPHARADAVAYLINITVRPGYGFADADEAIAYGRGLCARIDSGQTYADIIASVKADFDNPDEYQASYLIAQAANELCPKLIRQLRSSAAGYRSPAD